jgi:hypothetical protein
VTRIVTYASNVPQVSIIAMGFSATGALIKSTGSLTRSLADSVICMVVPYIVVLLSLKKDWRVEVPAY